MNDRRKLDLPDRRRTTYDELSERLDCHIENMENRLHRFFSKALWAFAVLGLTSAGALLGFGLVLKHEAEVSRQIQQQRYDALLQSCETTNERNKAVNEQIDKAIADLPTKEREKAEADSGPFRLILNAAVPYTEDCETFARGRLEGSL